MLGAYMPGRPDDQSFYGCPRGGPPCGPFPSYQQTGGLAVGGRVTAWLSNRAAIEGSFWFAPSHVTDVTPYADGYMGTDVAGHIVATDVRLVLSLIPQTREVSVLLMGGPAVIHRSGVLQNSSEFYSMSKTVFGGVVGFGLDIHPGRGFAIRTALEDYLYSFTFNNDRSPIDRVWFHHDFVLSLSIGSNLFGRHGQRR